MQELRQGVSGLKVWPVLGILVVQVSLLLAHWFIFNTWIVFWGTSSPAATLELRSVLFVLALSFIVAALLSFRYSNPVVIAIYKIAAVWLGFFNFFFVASCLSWLAWFGLRLSGLSTDPQRLRPSIVAVLFALGILAGIYGLLNARRIRVRRVPIKLAGLPGA